MDFGRGIYSGQQAGSGDATIFGNTSSNAIDNMLSIAINDNNQRQQQERQKEILQLQQQNNKEIIDKEYSNKSATNYYNTLSTTKTGLWDADIKEISQDIAGIHTLIAEYNKKGINPFDINNGEAFADVQQKLNLLQAKKEASDNAYKQYKDAYAIVNKDTKNMYDKIKFLDNALEYKNMGIEDRAEYSLSPTLMLPNMPEIINKSIGKQVEAEVKRIATVYDNEGNAENAKASLQALKDAIPEYIKTIFAPQLATGQLSENDVDRVSAEYIALFQSQPYYSDIKNRGLDIQQQNANTAKGRLEVSRKNAETSRINATKVNQGTNAHNLIGDIITSKTSTSILKNIPAENINGKDTYYGDVSRVYKGDNGATYITMQREYGDGTPAPPISYQVADANGESTNSVLYEILNRYYIENNMSYGTDGRPTDKVVVKEKPSDTNMVASTKKYILEKNGKKYESTMSQEQVKIAKGAGYTVIEKKK